MKAAAQSQDGAPSAAVNPDLDALQGEARRVDGEAEPAAAAAGAPPPGADAPQSGEHSISTARLVQGVLLGSGNLTAFSMSMV